MNQRILSYQDALLLSKLSEHLLRIADSETYAAEQLLEILSTATILPDGEIREDRVGIGSLVIYTEANLTQQETATIVPPEDGNPSLGRISILTPMALALIGRKIGTTVEVPLPLQRTKQFRIADVQCSAELRRLE